MLTPLQFKILQGMLISQLSSSKELSQYIDVSGPAFYQLIHRMIDSDLIAKSKEEDGMNYYSVLPNGETKYSITKEFYS
jgi:DNA-binding PadR family transcriptional regulator